MEKQLVLVRHGETEWSVSGQHTGRTDIPLTDQGRREALLVAPTLHGWKFSHHFASPLSRAQETARIAGFGDDLVIDEDLIEWDYGVYEGRRTADIREAQPGWNKWLQPIEDGESAQDVGVRADRAIGRLETAAAGGPVIVFSHGHLLAILIARWLGLDASAGRRFVLETGTASVLGVKREDRVLRVLNQRCGHDVIGP